MIKYIHNNLDDYTKLYLFYGNKTEVFLFFSFFFFTINKIKNDILLKDHLENYREYGKLKIIYYVDKVFISAYFF